MDKNEIATNSLNEYAQSQLEIHKAELNTRYYDRDLSSEELKAKALDAQRDIFKKELDEKIAEILKDGHKASLDALKDEYLKKLG